MSSLTSYLPSLLRNAWTPKPCHIQRLSFDIFVDHIFIHLPIEDIMSLRAVNRTFFLLTHEPIIWKRFLVRMKTPVPPLRPSFKYALQATDFEAEHLVTRALSLEDNWRSDTPKVKRYWRHDAHYRILDMALLPGGKFVLVSMRDVASQRYYIELVSLDHPAGSSAVARMRTRSKAYNMYARYLRFQGRNGIMVGYTCRTYDDGVQCDIDPSIFRDSDAIDPPHPFIFHTVCQFIAMDDVEELVDPRLQPGSDDYVRRARDSGPPFCQVAYLETTTRITCLSLFEKDGKAHMSFVKHPHVVVVLDLDARTQWQIKLSRYGGLPESDHQIWAIRVLPHQNDVLVLRDVVKERTNHARPQHEHLLELVRIPHPSHVEPVVVHPYERWIVDPREYTSFSLSDPIAPSIGLDHPRLPSQPSEPAPISLFGQTAGPLGMVHYLIWPTEMRHADAPSTWSFSLEYVVPQTVHVNFMPYATHVLAGASRAMMYTLETEKEEDARLLGIKRYLSPQLQPLWAQRAPEDPAEPISRRNRPELSKSFYCSFTLPANVRRKVESLGLAAITWDETIGRLCIACGDELRVHIIDFSSAARVDDRFRSWKHHKLVGMGVPK